MDSIFERVINRVFRTSASAPIATLLLLALFARCLPDPLEVKRMPGVEAELVISSQIMPDRSLAVLVTRTFGALEASDDSDLGALLDAVAVKDAVVTLTGPHMTDTLAFQGNGVYVTEALVLESGSVYRIDVKSPTWGSVYATTEVRPPASFKNIEAELYYNGYGDTLAQVTYTFMDPAGKNQYMINVQEVERKDVIENLVNPRAFTRLIDDEEFNGQSFGERFRVFPRDYQPGDSIVVVLADISEAYYQFMQLRLDNRYSLVEFISEPVDYPTNVVGGRGFFNLYTPDVAFFVFE